MNYDDLEDTVHRQLLHSLGGLDIGCDEDWSARHRAALSVAGTARCRP